MRNYEIADKDTVLKHSYRCEDDDGYVVDDYTGQRVKCEVCGGSMLLRYDYDSDRAYMMCNGNFIGTCTAVKDIVIKTPPCKVCGGQTVVRSRNMGGRVFLGCPTCRAKGISTRIQIGNAVFSDK